MQAKENIIITVIFNPFPLFFSKLACIYWEVSFGENTSQAYRLCFPSYVFIMWVYLFTTVDTNTFIMETQVDLVRDASTFGDY